MKAPIHGTSNDPTETAMAAAYAAAKKSTVKGRSRGKAKAKGKGKTASINRVIAEAAASGNDVASPWGGGLVPSTWGAE